MKDNIKLAIDSSQKIASCALSINDKIVIENKIDKSLENYIVLIDKTLKDINITINDVDELYVCTGPGSQMGIRNAIVLGNALSFALNIKVYGVLSIDAAATLECKKDTFKVCVEAGRTNWYIRTYNNTNGTIKPLDDLILIENKPDNYEPAFNTKTCATGVLEVAINQKHLVIKNNNNEVRQYE